MTNKLMVLLVTSKLKSIVVIDYIKDYLTLELDFKSLFVQFLLESRDLINVRFEESKLELI